MLTASDFPYDIETYPNLFTLAIKSYQGPGAVYEISERRNDFHAIHTLLHPDRKIRMIGFNNLGFDWIVLDWMLRNNISDPYQIWEYANMIINAEDKFEHIIWNPRITQIDLYKIHHFDNRARATSLKALQINMRSESVEDLPFPPGTYIPYEHIDTVRAYNWHDTCETEKFAEKSASMIEFREELGEHTLNYNDTKIGKKHFIDTLEKIQPGICYDGNRKPRQTHRPHGVCLSHVIFPYIKFENERLALTLEWLKNKTIFKTKDGLETCVDLNGFPLHIGLGGIHGSLETSKIYADDEHRVHDIDVTSYYPSIAIVNKVYPAHLGEVFCDVYRGLKAERVLHSKKSTKNKALKLALNGVYGDSNNIYGPFYDPAYMLSITINGQLLLCMLAEQLMKIPGLQLIQVNTDGVTIRYPVRYSHLVEEIYKSWESYTLMDLEHVDYSCMFIRDVNNYIAVPVQGDIKRKGAYEYSNLDWHKNHSALVVQQAAEAEMLYGVSVRDFIHSHDDAWDFLLRAKVPRSSRLEHGGNRVQNITRYYVSNSGGELVKIMPPLASKPNIERKIAVDKGYSVTICNQFDGVLNDLNHQYYIDKAKKLVL